MTETSDKGIKQHMKHIYNDVAQTKLHIYISFKG